MSDGADKLKDGTKTLFAGTNKLSAGAEQLYSGAKKLDKGTSDLVGGVDKLDDGAGKLLKGVHTLKDGVHELNDKGIHKITDILGKDAKEALNNLTDMFNAGKSYKSFSGIQDGMKGSVKFIFKTAEIRAEDK